MTNATKKKSAKKNAAKKKAAKKNTSKKKAARKAIATRARAKKPGAKERKSATKPMPGKTAAMSAKPAFGDAGDTAKLITERIREIGGWRGETMARMRALILEADPELVEERKWIKPSNPFGVPTYSKAGLVLTLEVYQSVVKVTFAHGSKVPDPTGIFNASLLGERRAVDIREGEIVDADAFKALVNGAIAVNVAKRGAA